MDERSPYGPDPGASANRAFRFSDFDRILLNRGEMGCSPQLYLNPVTTH
ncbi:hypothetical protein C8K30_107193 [Promicromonospora sp. AC04]|nr:hypothetical protein [Promicromonospora sp. AC04]PUB25447.1 hypothetical protein C8K30_107193 [Promicromonospora sp. AC04]